MLRGPHTRLTEENLSTLPCAPGRRRIIGMCGGVVGEFSRVVLRGWWWWWWCWGWWWWKCRWTCEVPSSYSPSCAFSATHSEATSSPQESFQVKDLRLQVEPWAATSSCGRLRSCPHSPSHLSGDHLGALYFSRLPFSPSFFTS